MITSFKKLYEIAQKLRGPDGCPWDQSRTIKDLAKDFEEEAQEVLDALANEDNENLREELGDTLFTILLMCVIAEEKGLFTTKEVLEEIQEKLIRRHTWVFGDDVANTPEEALEIWKRNKAKEKKGNGSSEK